MEELKNYRNIIDNKQFKELSKSFAHANVTVYNHSLFVAKTCIELNRHFNLHLNEEKLIVSALLHDFYFYDWHKAPKGIGLHGFTHPKTAAENAKKYFNIDDDIYDSIICHMWPLTIHRVPKSKEALVLCIADKICALKETFSVLKCKSLL